MIKRKMPPQHPGIIIRSELIDGRGLTVTRIAKMVKVSRQALSNVLNGNSEMTPEMALRITTVFGGEPDIWLRIQAAYDLEIAAKKIKKLKLLPYMDETAYLNSSKANARHLRRAIADMNKGIFIRRKLIEK